MKVTCLPENGSRGAFGVRFCWKKGVIQCGLKKKIFFECGILKMGVICVQRCNFKPKICKFDDLILELLQNL